MPIVASAVAITKNIEKSKRTYNNQYQYAIHCKPIYCGVLLYWNYYKILFVSIESLAQNSQ